MRETIPPTPERGRHDQVVIAADVLTYDRSGNPSRSDAFRAIDIIGALRRRGAVSDKQANAGNRFRRDFHTAQLSTMRAADMIRSPGGVMADMTTRVLDARHRLWGALDSIGGVVSKEGSCVYHVLGLEWSLTRWVREMRRCKSPATASVILVRALGHLATFYESS